MPKFNIVLYAPDIPGNTGSIGRTCVALDLRLILIKPYGFDLTEKAVRRAGLDYWKHVELAEYENWADFLEGEKPEQLCFFSKNGKEVYFQACFKAGSYLIFGSETAGLPQHIFETYPQDLYSLPMYSPHIRSLNLSNAATAVAYEALRQIDFV
jgi:tRNA (cytidine/uridine-2'-O-)-methyltransferase